MRSSCFFLSALLAGAFDIPQFNNTRCPGWWELQAPHMKDFKNEDIPGYYYELAFHDITQYPLCPSRSRCITSSKAIQTHSDGVKFVNDTWNLACFDHPYPQTLLFNMTDEPGYMRGYVPGEYAGTVFPDTVVDFKAGPDGWLLEFQCVEMLVWHIPRAVHKVAFVGINYYSKSNSEAAFQEIDAAARARGLYYYIDQGGVPGSRGLRRVNHTDCPKEPQTQTKNDSPQVSSTAGAMNELATFKSQEASNAPPPFDEVIEHAACIKDLHDCIPKGVGSERKCCSGNCKPVYGGFWCATGVSKNVTATSEEIAPSAFPAAQLTVVV